MSRSDARLAWLLVAPAMSLIALVAVAPLAASMWESLHLHDLRLPWLGRPFVGLAHYRAAVADARLHEALVHTAFFTAASVALELAFGMALALILHHLVRGRALARVVVLLPWALPAVVAALVWRFMFEGEWLSHPRGAWVPIVLGDVWKSTPFVALLLLAGLQAIDPALHEAAALDGAGPWRRFRSITLPLLRPVIAVALVFRMLDAFRVFDFVYLLTGGGPGTATEVISLYAFSTLFQELRFGYGAALSTVTFAIVFLLSLGWVRALRTGEDA